MLGVAPSRLVGEEFALFVGAMLAGEGSMGGEGCDFGGRREGLAAVSSASWIAASIFALACSEILSIPRSSSWRMV